MKQWTNGYGETMTEIEVGDKVRVYSPKYQMSWDTTITAILPGMPGYYRAEGSADLIWKDNITLVSGEE